MSRLHAHVLAFAVVLLLPFAVRVWLGRVRPPVSGGRGEAALELRIITPHNQDIRRAFELAFSDWHEQRYGQSVAVTYLSPGGTNDIVRYLEDLYGTYRDASGKLIPEAEVSVGIDLVWGGGDYAFERRFKPILKPLSLQSGLIDEAFPQKDLAGVSLIDPDVGVDQPKWVGVVLGSFGIIYAPEIYDVLGLPPPETWKDLARPELVGLLALADPTRSGTAATNYMMVLQRAMAASERSWLDDNPELAGGGAALENAPGYRTALGKGWKEGMRLLVLMAANARYFTDSGSRPCADVGDGESAAGVAIDFYARVYQEQIGDRRIQYRAPRGATAITPDPVGVLYGTRGQQEVVANRFVEFLLSKEGQRLWNLDAGQSPYLPRSLRRMPIRRDVYLDRTGFADDENPFEIAQGFNMQQRWMRQLGRLLPIWGAAWMDAKSTLDAAYRAVLAVKDPPRREQLLFELSDIPIEYDELTRPGPAGGGDPRLEAARDRLELGERFRKHYAEVLERARSSS